MVNLTDPIFTDADKAREHLEAQRWPNGPYCPHCGNADRERIAKMEGKAHRPGLYNCRECRKQFSVTVGTVFERSKVPLNKWLLATYLLTASKKGMSAHQLHRTIGVTYKTAWFMFHRIREAMRPDSMDPLGGGGGIVEVDETYTGPTIKRGTWGRKHIVLSLVDRNTGAARSFKIERANKNTILPILRENLDKEARVITDDYSVYHDLDEEYSHAFVVHSKKQWGRGEIHTNTIEGYYSIFKRGMKGVYQHCGEKHLHRYVAEFDFRYSNRSALGVEDTERANKALQGITGKRLTYRRTNEAQL